MSNDIKILDRHKKDLICDICTKKIWFFQKCVRAVIRVKDNIWAEYYHIKCMEKFGLLQKLEKTKKGRWDDEGTSNLVH